MKFTDLEGEVKKCLIRTKISLLRIKIYFSAPKNELVLEPVEKN